MLTNKNKRIKDNKIENNWTQMNDIKLSVFKSMKLIENSVKSKIIIIIYFCGGCCLKASPNSFNNLSLFY